MRLIELPELWTLALCFVIWPILQVSAALFCLLLPDRFFSPDSFLYRPHRWEDSGLIYERLLHVRRWKHMLPDGATAWKRRGYQKKHLEDFSPDNLRRFIIESARGELTHWLAIMPFWIFGFFTPMYVIGIMLIYALIANLPCIIVQRYNRPRIKRMLKEIELVTSNQQV